MIERLAHTRKGHGLVADQAAENSSEEYDKDCFAGARDRLFAIVKGGARIDGRGRLSAQVQGVRG
jgi:hypothetical protein